MYCTMRKVPKVANRLGQITDPTPPNSPKALRVRYCGTTVAWKGSRIIRI